MEIEVGSIVISKAGRDKGRRLVVVEVLDSSYCLVADGDLRKIDKPKKKKMMHLKKTNQDKVEIRSNSQLRQICSEVE